MEDPENLGSGMAGAGDSLVKQYPPTTHQFLEVPNNYSQDYWAPPRIYLDGDGDIRFEWFINVAAEDAPVHLEQVRDAISRIGLGWEQEVCPRLLELGIE